MNQKIVNSLAPALPWVVSLWLILLTGWYAATVVRALGHPLNEGNDLFWVKVWIGFVIVAVLSHLLIRRPWLTVIWLGALAATAITMFALSHQVIGALIAAWMLLLSWTWGDWILRRLHVPNQILSLDSVAVAVPLGFAVMALLALALCEIRLLTSKWAWIILSALTLVQYRSLVRIGREFFAWLPSRDRPPVTQSLPEFGILVVLLGFVFLIDLSWALAPEINSDAVAMHLPVAKYYVDHPVALLNYAGYVANSIDLLFAVGFSLYGQIVAKLFVLLSSVVSALGVFVLGRMLFGARIGLWAAALFYSTPLVSWLATTAFIDGPLTMFVLATTLAFFQWHESRQNGWLCVAGLLTGAAIAAKFNALLGLPVIGLLIAWDLVRGDRSARQRLKGIAAYVFGLCLVAGPGFVVRYILTGDPFFPIPVLSKLFQTSRGPAATLISNSNQFGFGTSPAALLKLPFTFTFQSGYFGENLPPGGVGLALLLAPLALITAFAGGVIARRTLILLAICVVYVSCLAFIMQYGRYYIPALPGIVILAVEPLIRLPKANWLRRLNLILFGVVLTLQVALTPLMYWNIPDRFPMRMAFGLETRESLLARALPLYAPLQFLNQKIKPGQKVLVIGANEGSHLYLNAPIMGPYDSEFREIFSHSTPDTFAANLMRNGYTYLLIDFTSWQSRFLPALYLDGPFQSRFTTLEYPTNNVKIYRLREGAVEPRNVTNLLSNPGFEVLTDFGYPAGWVPVGHPLIARNSGQAHAGKMAVRSDRDDFLNTHVPVEPNKIYSLGYWCRADKPNQFARLQINWLKEGFQVLGVSIEVVPAQSQWTSQRSTVLSPPGATLAEVYVSVHENSEVWFDDYVFVTGEIHAKP